MKLTYLGGGGENGEPASPSCFLLHICQTEVLLECPIDLSALLLFLPTVLPSGNHKPEFFAQKTGAGVPVPPSRSSWVPAAGNASSSTSVGGFDHKDTTSSGDRREMTLVANKRAKLGADKTTTHEWTSQKGASKNWNYREMNGRCLIDAAPWYRTPDFNQIDVTLLNAVIISNPLAMLGLPLLTRNPEFSAKIYATEATAKLGQLMMEELVALHSEFTQLYGKVPKSSIPPWLPGVLLSEVGEQTVGTDIGGEQWHPLYSAADIRDCMAKVHRLHYGEEANIDGCLNVKPSSSGFGIGASNWVIKGGHRSLSYITMSNALGNHSKPLDISALSGSEVLLFSKALQDQSWEEKRLSVPAPEDNTLEFKLKHSSSTETHQTGEGVTVSKQPPQRMSASPASSVSPAPPGSTAASQKQSSNIVLPATSEKSLRSVSEEHDGSGQGQASSLQVDKQIKSICKAGVEAVGAGGSVLIPMSFYGTFLETAEEMSCQLRSAGLEQVPIFYISPAAEELLAYVNTVPEWLCPARQEKLYAGEALFGILESLPEKLLHHFPSLHSSVQSWQEPCIVFATHWSLRVGSAVHLLHRWRNNPLCLLILTELDMDLQLLLAPFKPFSIQVLHLPTYSSLRSQDIADIIQSLNPPLTLVPETLKNLETRGDGSLGKFLCYKPSETLTIPRLHDDLEVEMSADLALQIQLKQVKSGKVAAARLSADLLVRDGRWSLEMPAPSTHSSGRPRSVPRYQIRWGKVDVDSLLTAFRERGMCDVYVTERKGQEDNTDEKGESREMTIEISSPSRAKIEITSAKISIHANEPALRRDIVGVLNTALNVF